MFTYACLELIRRLGNNDGTFAGRSQPGGRLRHVRERSSPGISGLQASLIGFYEENGA